MKILPIVIPTSLVAGAIACAASLPANSQSVATTPPVDSACNMHIPDNYRQAFEYLGSWSIAGDAKGAKEMHSVYASPGTVAAYRATGQFPNGTVLVKEVYGATTAVMTTGTVSRVDALKGWFMMVKDSKGSHPNNKLWGNGWGWSWFDADNPRKTTSTDFHADCLGCHIPAKQTDWINVSGYPGLK